ncbi:MAG: AAA family ATPase [Theionarchaea archaeon]|nr:AAA family ATPase [Theionarchaea archaeon]
MVISKATFAEKKTHERKKIKFIVEMKDFGPIAGGTITFRPLTLFIGPNNSGKSYAAMLIHSLFESFVLDVPGAMREFLSRYYDIDDFVKELAELDQIGDLKEGDELEISLGKITNRVFEEVHSKRMSHEIIRSYACPLRELARIGKKSFELKIACDSHKIELLFQADNPKIKWYSQEDFKMKVKVLGQHNIRTQFLKKDEPFFELTGSWKKNKKSLVISMIELPLSEYISNVFEDMAAPCYYLPAARSGILQGHKALAATIVRKAPLVGIEKLEIPKFSGVVSDFISSILTLPEEKGPFYKLAQELEGELLKGEIVVKTLDEYLYPEIRYNFRGKEIPLHRASSTVSELAPLILYLKYTIRPGSILIIEEPEAHLHPENQRILAKYLVKLIRKGVNIVITTHSDYLIEQLSSFILLSRVEPEKRISKYGYTREDFLNPGEVAAYVFTYEKKSGGHRIGEIEITEEDGISQEEHMRIIEALYEETLKLRRDTRHR